VCSNVAKRRPTNEQSWASWNNSVDVFCHDDTRKGKICTKKGVAVNISFFALPFFIVCLASCL